MEIRNATKADCRAIAELALMAGEGIPAFFWEQSAEPGEDLLAVGARHAASETENFSYRNVRLATLDGNITGMILAYRLPDEAHAEDVNAYPEFVRPLIELEHCAPSSFYINMLATYPEYRNQGIGRRLMGMVDGWAADTGCDVISVQVFEQNAGAYRLYRRLGYEERARRPVVPHPSHPYTDGDVVLLIRRVHTASVPD